MTKTQHRKEQAAQFAAQLGLNPEQLYAATDAVWSNLNPQTVSFDHALSVAAVALRAARDV